MKLCSIQGLLAVMLVSVCAAHPNYAQLLDKRVTLQLKDVPLESVLKAIEAQAEVKFFYSRENVDLKQKVSIQAIDQPLKKLMKELFDPLRIKYIVHDKTASVTLKMKSEERGEDHKDDSHSRFNDADTNLAAITGRVTDAETSQPMAGVNVIVKGTLKGTATDADGRFVIDADERDVLVFSFIGFKSIEIAVYTSSVLDVTMEADIKSLESVEINAGYWKVTNQERTGTISRVTADEIAKQPVSNPLAALQANVSGLQIIQPTGITGGNFKVNIRGVNSVANGNEPLYIIDGVPFTSQSLAQPETSSELFGNGPGFGTGPLNSINPADIESIEVLKDADATAIFGSRGSNGVIIITTKNGRAGKTKVDVKLYTGAGKIASKMKLLDSRQYLEMRREAYAGDGLSIPENAHDLMTWDTTRYTDWQNELIGGSAQTTDAQLGISGGDERTQFILNGGYHRETTVFPGDFSDQRISTHLKLAHRSADKKLGAQVSINYSAGVSDLLKQDLTGMAIILAPVAPPLYTEDGELNWENSTWLNPLSYLKRSYEADTRTMIGNVLLSYSVLPGLEVKAGLGFTDTGMKATTKTPVSSYDPALSQAFQNETAYSQSSFQNWNFEPQLSWTKKGSEWSLNILGGATFLGQESEALAQIGRGFSSEALMNNIKSAARVTIASDTYSQYKYSAVFGRINYVFKEKYILNLTGRRDGSSRFGPGKQFANFGAVGVAWLFSREGFMSGAGGILSFGKLRASYGLTGNDQLQDYEYLDSYTSSRGPYYGSIGLSPVRLSNPDFAWETNKKAEASIELGFFEHKLLLLANYYRNRSSNQLVGFPLPPTTGFNSIQGNFPATVQNTGLEIEANSENIRSQKFTWSTSLNVSFPRNELIEFPNIEAFPEYENTYVVGEPLGIRKLYRFTGISSTSGLYQFEDVNGDGFLGSADRKTVKFVGTDFYGGLQNTIRLAGFELSFTFQFVKQTGNNYLYSGWTLAPGLLSNQRSIVTGRWQESGDDASIQRYTTDSSSPYIYTRSSDLSVGDASFIRLKNISLSYSFPQNWLNALRIVEGRLFLQGQNVLTFTNYEGLDPENQLASILPPLKVLTGGIHLAF